MYRTQRQTSKESSQMPHIVDVVRVWGEDEYKEHDDYSDKDQLALE